LKTVSSTTHDFRLLTEDPLLSYPSKAGFFAMTEKYSNFQSAICNLKSEIGENQLFYG
jgi:hypothetical protein